ncbi:MAG: hypothetical protein WCO56_03000 [Verrucomicrobiota bacterium]
MNLMSVNLGEYLVKGSAWCSAFLMLAAFLAARRERPTRNLWTAACAVYLLHFCLGFGGYHNWSHAAAASYTAMLTYDVIHVRTSAVLWGNYLFTLVWVADVLWWWLWPMARQQRPRWVALIIYGFLATIMFCGTFIFTSNPLRWVILGGVIAVSSVRCRNRAMNNTPEPPLPA